MNDGNFEAKIKASKKLSEKILLTSLSLKPNKTSLLETRAKTFRSYQLVRLSHSQPNKVDPNIPANVPEAEANPIGCCESIENCDLQKKERYQRSEVIFFGLKRNKVIHAKYLTEN